MRKSSITLLTTILAISSSAYASVPLSFTHHGVLKEDGNLVNGDRNIVATILDDQGEVVGKVDETVPVKAGLYTLVINNIDVAKVVTADKLILNINVEGQDLGPALNITAVPYALAAKQSESATSVSCKGCITPEHLSFNALQDSALPNCGVNQVLRQADGSVWECADVVQLLNDPKSVSISGKIGVNTSDFSFGAFSYELAESNVSTLAEGITACQCDQGGSAYECGNQFSGKEDNGSLCYDNFGPVYNIYKRSSFLGPLSDVVVVADGAIGIGTGRPAAPIHLRTTNGQGNYEVIVADTAPEILLEDLDGNNYAVSLNDGKLSISSIDDGATTELMTIDDNGLTVAGNISAGGFASDFAVGAANVDFNYAASKSKGGAASSIEDNIVTSAKIKDGAIAAADLAADAVVTAKIKDANVTKAKLDSSVQTSLGYADNSIQKTTGSVTSTYILDGTIATADLANSSVTSAKILDGTISNADIADSTIAKGKLESSVQTSLGLADNSLQKTTGSVTSTYIKDGTISNADIADTTITKGKLATAVQTSLGYADNSIQKSTGSVTSTYILDGTIATADLANSSVTSAKIADGTISNADIADSTITKGKLAAAVQTSLGLADNSIQKTTGSVTSAYIKDGTIATADLADGSVTEAKLKDIYAAKAFGHYKRVCMAVDACNVILGSYSISCSSYKINDLASKNIASITVPSTGSYKVTFKNAMKTDNYAVLVNNDAGFDYYSKITSKDTTGFTVTFYKHTIKLNSTTTDGVVSYSLSQSNPVTSISPILTSCSQVLFGSEEECNQCRADILASSNNKTFTFAVFE